MQILGLTGKMGAGKTTAAAYIGRRFDLKSLSFVDKILVPEVRKRKQEVNRTSLQAIGRELYLKHGDLLLTDWLLADLDSSQNWMIDDIRYFTTAQYIHGKFPETFQLIGVVTSSRMRYQRILERGREGRITYLEFQKLDTGATEIEIDRVVEKADFVIVNETSLDDLHAECDRIMAAILKVWGQAD